MIILTAKDYLGLLKDKDKNMKNTQKSIAFFGSSLVSAYWNGAATYYRGMIKALHALGHKITFYEPDILSRQEFRDIPDPEWCEVKIYQPKEEELRNCLEEAAEADIIIKASGIGVFDEWLESSIHELKTKDNLILFWDVDAPATLDRIHNNANDAFLDSISRFDFILTYGGGPKVVEHYQLAGANKCIPIYNALDPSTHFRVKEKEKFSGDLGFLGNRLPDREKRVDEFFVRAAKDLPSHQFLIGGSGWDNKLLPPNVRNLGHVFTKDHNAFNCSAKMILNISRDSMASYGYSPATRIFEAAGAGACMITDYWEGIEQFFEPGEEIFVAKSGGEVANLVKNITPEEARAIGRNAYKKVIEQHTYRQRAEQFQEVVEKWKKNNLVSLSKN